MPAAIYSIVHFLFSVWEYDNTLRKKIEGKKNPGLEFIADLLMNTLCAVASLQQIF